MNTRGLVELIVLNVGYELGILSPRIFAMLVLMALVTTFSTAPLLALADRLREKKRSKMQETLAASPHVVTVRRPRRAHRRPRPSPGRIGRNPRDGVARLDHAFLEDAEVEARAPRRGERPHERHRPELPPSFAHGVRGRVTATRAVPIS